MDTDLFYFSVIIIT